LGKHKYIHKFEIVIIKLKKPTLLIFLLFFNIFLVCARAGGGGVVSSLWIHHICWCVPTLGEAFYFDVHIFSGGITTHKPRQEVPFLFFPIDYHL